MPIIALYMLPFAVLAAFIVNAPLFVWRERDHHAHRIELGSHH
jgi:hypothetical protein